MRREFANLIKQELVSNKSSVVLLGDISVGLFILPDESLPARCHNVGILEQSMISLAAGMASAGMLPIVHTIAAFLVERTVEQIKLDLLYNQNKVILVSANGPYDYNKLGPTHHSANDVTILNDLGCNCFLPFSSQSLEDCFIAAKAAGASSYIRLSKIQYDDLDSIEKIGNARFIGQGKSETLQVFVGEASDRYFKSKRDSVDALFVCDLSSLPSEQIARYKKIEFFEPYGRPILAHICLVEQKNKEIVSWIYPKNKEEGIFDEVEYEHEFTVSV